MITEKELFLCTYIAEGLITIALISNRLACGIEGAHVVFRGTAVTAADSVDHIANVFGDVVEADAGLIIKQLATRHHFPAIRIIG